MTNPPCRSCGQPTHHPSARWCRKEKCQEAKYQNQLRLQREGYRATHPEVTRTCPWCGEEFVAKGKNKVCDKKECQDAKRQELAKTKAHRRSLTSKDDSVPVWTCPGEQEDRGTFWKSHNPPRYCQRCGREIKQKWGNGILVFDWRIHCASCKVLRQAMEDHIDSAWNEYAGATG